MWVGLGWVRFDVVRNGTMGGFVGQGYKCFGYKRAIITSRLHIFLVLVVLSVLHVYFGCWLQFRSSEQVYHVFVPKCYI